MKKIIALLMCALMLFAAVSCGGEKSGGITATTDGSSSSERTLTGRDGTKLTLPATVTKVVSLYDAATDIIIAVGGADKIVGVDAASAKLTGVPAGAKTIAVEAAKITELAPQIVFISETDATEAIAKAVSDAGIVLAKIPAAADADDIKEDVKLISNAIGLKSAGDSAATKITNSLSTLSNIGSSKSAKTVYVELGDKYYTSGGKTYVNELISVAGGKNIFADKSGYLNAAEADIIAADPQVIFFVDDAAYKTVSTAADAAKKTYDDAVAANSNKADEALATYNSALAKIYSDAAKSILSRAGWENVAAVKNSKVYVISSEILRASQSVVTSAQLMYDYMDKYDTVNAG